MRNVIKKLERMLGRRTDPAPYAHLSDEEVLEALRRTQRGEPSGMNPYPGDPETWPPVPPDLAALSDEELMQRLQSFAAQLQENKSKNA